MHQNVLKKQIKLVIKLTIGESNPMSRTEMCIHSVAPQLCGECVMNAPFK
jgi:hypothetical protein